MRGDKKGDRVMGVLSTNVCTIEGSAETQSDVFCGDFALWGEIVSDEGYCVNIDPENKGA